ncbi:response regulator [Brevibacterium permense]|uniref:Response regulator n=2 Tax=Brevibacterium permense TaxID=234834 RepID=A0ABN2AK57_9MICO
MRQSEPEVREWGGMDSKNALVIEDDDDIRRLLEVVLEQSGYTVESVATGKLGLERFDEVERTLITVDLGLPDIDGLELLRQIRPRTVATILVISARATQRDSDASVEAGADAFLTKPFKPREIREFLQEMDTE